MIFEREFNEAKAAHAPMSKHDEYIALCFWVRANGKWVRMLRNLRDAHHDGMLVMKTFPDPDAKQKGKDFEAIAKFLSELLEK